MRDYGAASPLAAFAMPRDTIMSGSAAVYAEDVLAELAREPADVLAIDMTLWAGLATARACR